MKKTRIFPIYPLSRGVDRSSIPGTQDIRSLKVAKNVIIGSRPSLRKRPGSRRIPYIGQDDGTQAAIHFFATTSNSQTSEVVRVRKGKVEALRDISGAGPEFITLQHDDGTGVLSEFTVSDTDTIVFERFGNALIIHFENTRPQYYVMGGNLFDLPILTSHVTSPPTFSRRHEFRLFYAGRKASPHTLYMSAPNNITDYSLFGGGGSFRVNDGDGDPAGLTAISPPYKGSLFLYKWMSLYEFARGPYGYGWTQVSDETGAVHHNAVTASRVDVYSVDTSGIHSLNTTMQAGGAPEGALTSRIYEYFQESVNWSNSKNMVLVYDKVTSTLLLSYAKGGSGVNNAVLGMNVFSKEFFEWEDIEYPSIGRYFEFGVQRTMVADNDRGISLLDQTVTTLEGDPINVEVETGLIFPMGNPKVECGFTQAWLLCRPTLLSVSVDIYYSIDGKEEVKTSVDISGSGYGSTIEDTLSEGGELIGEDIIGQMDNEMATIPFSFQGEGSSLRFRLVHEPSEADADQPLEIYGIVIEIENNEDSELKETA